MYLSDQIVSQVREHRGYRSQERHRVGPASQTGRTLLADVGGRRRRRRRTPTKAPTRKPTKAPTAPTPAPTPTSAPTGAPTSAPTGAPTRAPTREPTKKPTKAPTTVCADGYNYLKGDRSGWGKVPALLCYPHLSSRLLFFVLPCSALLSPALPCSPLLCAPFLRSPPLRSALLPSPSLSSVLLFCSAPLSSPFPSITLPLVACSHMPSMV